VRIWRAVCVGLLVALAAAVFAQRDAPWLSNGAFAAGSTSQEVALYEEGFGSGRAAGWNLQAGWEVVQDSQGGWMLRGQGHAWAEYFGDSWGDCSLVLRMKLVRGCIHLNYRRSADGCTRYFIGFNEEGIYLNRTAPCGTTATLKHVTKSLRQNRWYEIRITGSGGKIQVSVDGTAALSYTDAQPLLFGRIALETLDDTEAYVDEVRVVTEATAATGLVWVRTGGPLGGLGYDIRMRSDNSDVLYVTDARSGVSVSRDGGRTWHSANEGINTRTGPSGDAVPVFSLTIDPHSPDTIWCGTQNRRGIWKSTDGGKTWVEKLLGVVETEGISFRGFTVDPRDSRIVYAAAEISSFAWTPDHQDRTGQYFDLTKGVVYKTTDGGEHWSEFWRGDNLARYVWIDPQNPDTVYISTGIFDREAANGTGIGIVKTTDGGRTWRVLGTRNGLGNLYVGSLFMHPQDAATLLAGTGNNVFRIGSGVYLSTNGGETWSQVLDTQQCPVGSVEFASGNPRIAYAGTASAIYRSEDGGFSWHQMTQGSMYGPPGVRAGVPIDFQVDPRNPDRIFANNYGGGNFLSEDGGQTWIVASQGYTGAQLNDVAVDPRDSRHVYVVGRSGPFQTRDGGATWQGLNYDPADFAEWYSVALCPRNPDDVLLSDEHTGTLLRSRDAGLHWAAAFRHPALARLDGGTQQGQQGFKALSFATSNPDVIYAAMCNDCNFYPPSAEKLRSYGVWKSTDGGTTWREASDTNIADQNVTALAVDSGQDEVVYAGTKNAGIFKSLNGGSTWELMSDGLRVLDIRALAIDPRSPQTLYVGAENGGIYKSADGSASWAAASSGMDPEAAIRDIVIDPTNPQVLYAADLRTGVYRSPDGAKTWVKINEGLRTRAVKALAISADGKILYAATEGEGVFRLDLP